MTSGFLYVLNHPSDERLYKVGQTSRRPEERLVEHNTKNAEYTGKIVKRTGQRWEMKSCIAVCDRYWAEAVFWQATPLADIPYRWGIEVQEMEWEWIQAGLNAAKEAGIRPPPGPLPDYVYANTAWLKKRLVDRGIKVSGVVRSKTSGRNTFYCGNGHEWRAVPRDVADGEGCPRCGMGRCAAEEVSRAARTGVLNLLIHPYKPGMIRIGLMSATSETDNEHLGDGWQVHRYRNVEEPALAEALIWELLGFSSIGGVEPISVDLPNAEQAFRDMFLRMQSVIALAEKAKHLRSDRVGLGG